MSCREYVVKVLSYFCLYGKTCQNFIFVITTYELLVSLKKPLSINIYSVVLKQGWGFIPLPLHKDNGTHCIYISSQNHKQIYYLMFRTTIGPIFFCAGFYAPLKLVKCKRKSSIVSIMNSISHIRPYDLALLWADRWALWLTQRAVYKDQKD